MSSEFPATPATANSTVPFRTGMAVERLYRKCYVAYRTGGDLRVEWVLLLALAIGVVMAVAVFAARAVQRPQRRIRRRQRAARHAANVRLWNKLFARQDRRLLTDQRALAPERTRNL